MDPLSITASILAVVNAALSTTTALTKYARDTKNATSDRRLLAEETLFLSKLLQRLRDRFEKARPNETWLADQKDIVRQFEAAYDDLAMTLKIDTVTGQIRQQSKLRAARTMLTWSFSKSEIYSLLERITRLQQHANLLLVDDQHTLLERMDQKQQEALDQRLRTSLLNWLSPLPMAQTHQTVSDRAEKGSGKWFLSDPAFQDWADNDETRLWCWGIRKLLHALLFFANRRVPAGAGKTVMASIIINYLRHNRPEESKGSVGIAFIYFKYNETDQTFENVLSSLLQQLLQDSEDIAPNLLSLYERHRDRNTSPTTSEISQALSTMIENHKEVFCVIDALDECHETIRWELIEKLESLGPKVRVLITSRYLDSIAEELDTYQRFEIRASKADIELFVEHQIRRNRNLRKIVQRSPSLRDDIKQGVFNTAENMFLLARLHVESLASAAGLSVKHVRNKLRTLPSTLKGTYDDAMERIENQEPDHRRIALKAMAWVCYAFRALSLRELQHALAVEPGDTVLDEDLLMDGQSITSLCAGLVVVDQRTNIVNLVHYSTKSYFDDTRHIQFPEYQAKITLICATYPTLDSLKGAKIWEIVQDYPLACYAAQFMGDHARNSPEESLEPSILDMICNLLSHPDKRKPLLSLLDGLDLIQAGFYSKGKPMTRAQTETLVDVFMETEIPALLDSVLEIRDSDTSSITSSRNTTASDTSTLMGDRAEDEEFWETKIKSSRVPEVTALHLAASMGLAKVASLLLKGTTNIDAVDETGKTALALALERGFEKAVEFLLKSGACVDLRHDHGQAVLLLITERGWYNAGEILVEKNRLTVQEEEAPGRTQDRVYFLLAAYENNVGELMRLATKNELQLRSTDRDISAAALFLAIEKGLVQMVETLLELGTDVNCKDNLGQTALHRATRRADEKMVKLLLKSGADVECKDDNHRTPWSANLQCKSPGILQILLDAGADPSTCGRRGVSELYTAAEDGNTELVDYMLKSGTNPSIQTQYGWAPLHWAACCGHVDCVRLLLESGADPNSISDQRVTPLDLATQADQSVVLELLRDVGARLYQDTEIAAENPFNDADRNTEGISTSSPDQYTTTTESLDAVKLHLVYDKPLARTLSKSAAVGRFVYPAGTTGPTNNIYEVSHFLETSSAAINVRRSKTRAEMWEYSRSESRFDAGNMLYEIIKIKADYQEFELSGRQQNPLTDTLTMHKDWTGGWKVHHKKEGNSKQYLLRTTPEWSKSKEEDSRWMLEDGVLQARSGWDDATPWICIELGVRQQMQDLIVTCWVVKLWSETAALHGHD
ncbi:MAG: hypothetical protein Q9218_004239 [Villophora microphyllina]